MNIIFDDNVKIITPCFLSGADQNIAEIRASSIRGEWRWWFRVLGGTKVEESAVFGSAAGDSGIASKVIVRASMISAGDEEDIRLGGPSDPLMYLLYFVAPPKEKLIKEKRMLAPNSEFRLQVLAKAGLDERLRKKAEDSLWAMLRFGAIGYRARRACGALSAEKLTFADFKRYAQELKEKNIEVVWLENSSGQPLFYKNWKPVLKEFGTILKELRKDGYSAGRSGGTMTPFGNAGNKQIARQASGVRLRPILLDEGILPTIVYVESVLDNRCRDKNFYLQGKYVGSGVLKGV